jgi:hypothetical protein
MYISLLHREKKAKERENEESVILFKTVERNTNINPPKESDDFKQCIEFFPTERKS